jgi:hypothetical protein
MNAYKQIRLLGKGSFGEAILCSKKSDGSQYVVKKVNIQAMPEKEKLDAIAEATVLQSLNHPYIVAYFDCFTDRGSLCIILEYADSGDLGMQIEKAAERDRFFKEAQILTWFAQIASAVFFVHSRNILHRDLKTQNIFLKGKRPPMCKLGDFGIAKVLDKTDQMAQTIIGTPYYMSPELCEDEPYNRKSDIWALGCILYELITLKHAFEGKNMCSLVLKILRGKYNPLPTKGRGSCSPETAQLVDSILQQKPADRPDLDKILQLPFIKEHLNKSQGSARKSAVGRRSAPGVPGRSAPGAPSTKGPVKRDSVEHKRRAGAKAGGLADVAAAAAQGRGPAKGPSSPSAASAPTRVAYDVADRVDVKRRGVWVRGIVQEVLRANYYAVALDSGELVRNVNRKDMRIVETRTTKSQSTEKKGNNGKEAKDDAKRERQKREEERQRRETDRQKRKEEQQRVLDEKKKHEEELLAKEREEQSRLRQKREGDRQKRKHEQEAKKKAEQERQQAEQERQKAAAAAAASSKPKPVSKRKSIIMAAAESAVASAEVTKPLPASPAPSNPTEVDNAEDEEPRRESPTLTPEQQERRKGERKSVAEFYKTPNVRRKVSVGKNAIRGRGRAGAGGRRSTFNGSSLGVGADADISPASAPASQVALSSSLDGRKSGIQDAPANVRTAGQSFSAQREHMASLTNSSPGGFGPMFSPSDSSPAVVNPDSPIAPEEGFSELAAFSEEEADDDEDEQREMIEHFMQSTGEDAATAKFYVDGAIERGLSVADALTYFYRIIEAAEAGDEEEEVVEVAHVNPLSVQQPADGEGGGPLAPAVDEFGETVVVRHRSDTARQREYFENTVTGETGWTVASVMPSGGHDNYERTGIHKGRVQKKAVQLEIGARGTKAGHDKKTGKSKRKSYGLSAIHGSKDKMSALAQQFGGVKVKTLATVDDEDGAEQDEESTDEEEADEGQEEEEGDEVWEVQAPLAEGWIEYPDPASGQSYYVHSVTRESQWERPTAERMSEEGFSSSELGTNEFSSSELGTNEWERDSEHVFEKEGRDARKVGKSTDKLTHTEIFDESSYDTREYDPMGNTKQQMNATRLANARAAGASDAVQVWEEHLDVETGAAYFVNTVSGESTWERPEEKSGANQIVNVAEPVHTEGAAAEGAAAVYDSDDENEEGDAAGDAAGGAAGGAAEDAAGSEATVAKKKRKPKRLSWEEHLDPDSGANYFVHAVTRESRWQMPPASPATSSPGTASEEQSSLAGVAEGGEAEEEEDLAATVELGKPEVDSRPSETDLRTPVKAVWDFSDSLDKSQKVEEKVEEEGGTEEAKVGEKENGGEEAGKEGGEKEGSGKEKQEAEQEAEPDKVDKQRSNRRITSILHPEVTKDASKEGVKDDKEGAMEASKDASKEGVKEGVKDDKEGAKKDEFDKAWSKKKVRSVHSDSNLQH